MAIHPSRLLLALMLVLLLYLGGWGLDVIWGSRVHAGELEQYLSLSYENYSLWLDSRLGDGSRVASYQLPIFQTIKEFEVDSFNRLVSAATSLDFGLRDMLAGKGFLSRGVIGELARMCLAVPGWLYTTHPGFLALFLLYAFLLTAALGGAITRLAALDACRQLRPSAFTALRFAFKRYLYFVFTPILPLAVIVFVGLLLAVTGFVLFNVSWLEIIGALAYGPLLLGGFAIALVSVGLVASVALMPSAVAVEGAGPWDAVSRAFNYALGRPWRLLFYNAVMVVYGALTYIFVGFLVFLTLWMTKVFTAMLVFRTVDTGQSRFDVILPAPELGNLVYEVDMSALDTSGRIAAVVIMVWARLLIFLLPAFAISFFFCAQTWIYLLLRRNADETSYEDIFLEADDEPLGLTAPNKIEPS